MKKSMIPAPGKRGFTLVELIVTMTVAAIAVAMVTTFCLLVSNRLSAQRADSERREQLNEFKSELSDWFYKNDRSDVSICVDTSAEGTQTLRAGDEFFSAGLTKRIISVTFEESSEREGLFKAVATLDDERTETILLLRRTVPPSP